jgi:hypothetical protein
MRRAFITLLVALAASSTAGCGGAAGVSLTTNSSFAYSFPSSFAKYVPSGNGCTAQYSGVMLSDPQWDRSVQFGFSPAPTLNQSYTLAPSVQTGAPATPNFLVGNGTAIQVNVNGIEASGKSDHVVGGSVTVRNLSGDLAFAFLVNFADGKTLQGDFDLPLKEGQCPGPL